ncbi:MAG: hypothetical protein K0S44_28 [Bacteroidetes bacterium]|jgi:hypothetical protein|nr:hypothetical protein [Bacteroidota bacterium]
MSIKRFLKLNSTTIIWLIVFSWVCIIGSSRHWEKNLISNDVVSYYGYLPAAIIHHDIKLDFIVGHDEYAGKYWPENAPNGGRVIKTTMGLSFLYLPFFLTGHAIAKVFDYPADGYSAPYLILMLLSCLFYLVIGFHFLRKLLLIFFTDGITSLTMASVFFGTNLLWYATFDGLMSHAYLFTILIVFIYLVVKWHQEQQLKTAILIGLSGGLMTLIRPTMIVCFVIFALYSVYDKQSFTAKLKQLTGRPFHLVIIALCAFIVLLPQLAYWKYITGNFFFFSYVGERFYWNNPHIIEGLIGFRKGWLLYTPIMVFAIAGVFYMRKNVPEFLLSVAILLPLLIYVFFSWWAWWYGGSFGLRAFVDYYGLLAIPLASFYTQAFQAKFKKIKWVVATAAFLLIFLNMFQTWQFNKGLIHYDSMTKESYILGFGMKHHTAEWYDALEAPDYNRARKGISETYSEEEIKNITAANQIRFKGFNNLFVTCEIAGRKELTSTRNEPSEWETFSFVPLGNNKVAIKVADGNYISAETEMTDKLYGNKPEIGSQETFELIYLGNNRFALKAANGKYVHVNSKDPFLLKVNAKSIGKREKLRIYIN